MYNDGRGGTGTATAHLVASDTKQQLLSKKLASKQQCTTMDEVERAQLLHEYLTRDCVRRPASVPHRRLSLPLTRQHFQLGVSVSADCKNAISLYRLRKTGGFTRSLALYYCYEAE
ncbi:hypothetical protein J6590_007121 [Homalodisca vitripennis]|nr:hypothetical protein J6590_007121 [Homalodisca vitripennis]